LKKFKKIESNNTVELAILIESYIEKLDKLFDRGEISPEDYVATRKKVNSFIDESKNMVQNWKEELLNE
jgi:hypothetical protein